MTLCDILRGKSCTTEARDTFSPLFLSKDCSCNRASSNACVYWCSAATMAFKSLCNGITFPRYIAASKVALELNDFFSHRKTLNTYVLGPVDRNTRELLPSASTTFECGCEGVWQAAEARVSEKVHLSAEVQNMQPSSASLLPGRLGSSVEVFSMPPSQNKDGTKKVGAWGRVERTKDFNIRPW